MEIAEEFGLPIEAINPAGAFFLRKISNWEKKLIVIHNGANATISRPNLELFFELKLARLTESDVEDCINYMNYTIDKNEPFDSGKILEICKAHLNVPAKVLKINKLIAAVKPKV